MRILLVLTIFAGVASAQNIGKFVISDEALSRFWNAAYHRRRPDCAIGVGGSNKDEECAYASLTSVVGPQPALAGPAPQAQAPQR